MAGLCSLFSSDELGLAAALARNGSHYVELQRQSALPARNFELAFELTYLMQLGQRLAVQPDIQYVLWPGNDPNRNSALVLGLRFELHT
jgi:carbohydrate-selective porin OprB